MKATSIPTGAALLLTAILSSAGPPEPSATISFTLPAGSTFAAPALVNPWLECRKPAAVTPATLTFSGVSWPAGAFNNHYVELTGGPGEGCWGEIVGNTATALMVTADFTAFSPGLHDFVIRKHVTLAQFAGGSFGAFQDVITLPAGPSLAGPSYLYDGVDWVDAVTFNPAGDVPVPPCQALLINVTSPVMHSFSGRVRQNKICCPLVPGWNLLPQPASPSPAPFGNWTLGSSLLPPPLLTGMVMVIPNLTSFSGPPAIYFNPAGPWTGGGSAATVLNAGGVAMVFAMPGHSKWCR